MNYKLQVHFLNDVTTWRAYVPALITMDIINSPFLHQCRLHSNGNGFKIVQKSFIQSSSNLQEANHLGFSCQQRLWSWKKNNSGFITGTLTLTTKTDKRLKTKRWENTYVSRMRLS